MGLVPRVEGSTGRGQLARSCRVWLGRYGLRFHLHATGDTVWLEGYDAGVSFASLHQPSTSLTYTVISNWSKGAWPIVQLLDERVGLR